EADIVKRIFKEFIKRKSVSQIAKDLNVAKIPTKKGFQGGWNTSTLSRILKNEKYTGLWIWRKWKNIRDPMTGKIKKVPRPKKEQLSSYKEELVIIDKEIWSKAQKRWKEIEGTWPVRKKANSNGLKQKSYIQACPSHLFSGLMKCHSCGGAIVLISGKGSGYYGCYNTKRKTCNNNLLVPRKRVEKVIISELKDKILIAENLEYVYKNLEKHIAKGLDKAPEIIKKKKSQYEKYMSEIQNYINYIKVGNFTKAVSEALKDAEKRSDIIRQEIKLLEFQKQNTFKSPPKEWINHRLEKSHETLSKNTTAYALALRKFQGPILLEPVSEPPVNFEIAALPSIARNDTLSPGIATLPRNDMLSHEIVKLPSVARNDDGKEFKLYYIAHTKIQTLALLDDKNKGSNWLYWRTRLQPIRTAAEIMAQIKICPVRRVYLYQKYSQKAKELRLLGMSYQQISKSLNVSRKTVINAYKHKKI
ncbi:MAG: recombinase family protein, partial [Deltaproteobacteria bacterium]|nr:recombinase family protein [Deltaproteobacteria bacterium]